MDVRAVVGPDDASRVAGVTSFSATLVSDRFST